ncbi:hypothetical protein COEREDRAFT_86374 [Coemansia reversa NRRL 1564]|uniref:Uncharacterized protein n=1 Tax=Coemansia reversa (strain ATCC 12441 / NRRL 1564) TaxID=763665 RepID=A0A2G5BEE2_COERN|nr:hypothetical protein COEREDRAFT_86374 [Coemansia reversa NRRL 1564]|eukprot:PIA17388.1 hypothetical protein COEREDRAFT_86374 [Coemansia reversa NRRL 1564]
MFSILYSAIVLELLTSIGVFGALVAQNMFTNSAAGWYVGLDWTAIYTYAISIFSIITCFILALAGLARRASGSCQCCFHLFNPFGIFVIALLHSILWIVIAGFSYRNPLPIKYPCNIFHHLQRNLQRLSFISGKTIIEEDGFLVGICQSSKAFLVLAGIGLGLWIVILISSCGAMVAGLGSTKKDTSSKSSQRSLHSALSQLKKIGKNTQPLTVPLSYPNGYHYDYPLHKSPSNLAEPINAAQTTHLGYQANRCLNKKSNNNMQNIRTPKETTIKKANVVYNTSSPTSSYQCPLHCVYNSGFNQQQQIQANRKEHIINSTSSISNLQNDNVNIKHDYPKHIKPNNAFETDGYSRDISPPPVLSNKVNQQCFYKPHVPYKTLMHLPINGTDVSNDITDVENEHSKQIDIHYKLDNCYEYASHNCHNRPQSALHNTVPTHKQHGKQSFSHGTN